MVFWIRACCILHNLLFEDGHDDGWEKTEEPADFDAEEVTAQKREEDTQGKQKRDLIKAAVFQNHALLTFVEF